MTKPCVEKISSTLQEELGEVVIKYHAGMDDPSRTISQVAWMSGKSHVVVATTAFVMGIDKPDVVNLVYFGLPSCMSSYYQAVGRAGRDNRDATARQRHYFGVAKMK